MRFHLNRRFLLVAVPLFVLTLTACAGQINNPEGWSGGTVDGDTLYIGTRAGDVRALDVASGFTKWSFELQGDDKLRGVYGAPAVTEDSIYVGGYDGILYSLSHDGVLQWRDPPLTTEKSVRGPMVGNPVFADGVVLAGYDDGNLYAFDVEDRTSRLVFQTEHQLWSSPVIDNGVVYLTSQDKKIYAVKLEDGSKLWEFETGAAIVSTPVVDGGNVYVGSFDGIFYAVNAATGELKWKFEGGNNWYWGEALVVDDTVYAGSLDGNLYALDRSTGNLRWAFAAEGPIVGRPAIVFDKLVVPSDDGSMHILNLSDGTQVSVCGIGSEIRSPLSQQDDQVFFNVGDGTVRTLRIQPNGDPDELWVHDATEDDPVDPLRPHRC